AAMAGVTAAEDRLLQGRWYACENPGKSTGQFGLTIDEQSQATAFVVCQDTYSRVAVQNGEYPSSRGNITISTPHGYFHTLHSIEIFSRGSCKNITRMIFARLIISPEPLAYGGSMEGIRNLAEEDRGTFSQGELVFSTWEGSVNGAAKTFICLPSRAGKAGEQNERQEKWKYQVLVSPGELFSRGQQLYKAERSGTSVTKVADRDGKVLNVVRSSGEGDDDDPLLVTRDTNTFESSGLTLKKIVRLTPIPENMTGNDDPTSETGCRAIVRRYVDALNADYLNRAGVVFENETNIPETPLSDTEAERILKTRSTPLTEPAFIQAFLPGFIPPNLSAPEKADFAAKASVILDQSSSPSNAPSIDELLIHSHYIGPWPAGRAKDAMRFSQPGAIRKMLDAQQSRIDSTSVPAFIRTANTFQKSTYFWKCDYRGPAKEKQEILDHDFDSGNRTLPPGSEWIQVCGMNYLVLSKTNGQWNDNAYDLEFNEDRIHMSDVAKFLAKIATGSGEIPSETGPEMVFITDARNSVSRHPQ
ncbi:MAG TPA: hypothetical protein PKM25_03585, partial [Candidatus Ozemobacteraceae bacterium]|nr:hypothetical protein [Candidatus Ozemobacteraceae bacterium]